MTTYTDDSSPPDWELEAPPTWGEFALFTVLLILTMRGVFALWSDIF